MIARYNFKILFIITLLLNQYLFPQSLQEELDKLRNRSFFEIEEVQPEVLSIEDNSSGKLFFKNTAVKKIKKKAMLILQLT